MTQRIIKFRAWDEEISKLYLWEEVKKMGFYAFKECGKVSSTYHLMQFTGLTDKNGKEIFEGDVVQVFTKELKEPAYTVTIRDMMKDQFIGVGNGEGEIIGNIYENKELLK